MGLLLRSFLFRRQQPLLSGLLLCTASAVAQKAPLVPGAPEPVYSVVEQMPQLPGGGGSAAVVAFLQQHVAYPAPAAQARAEGRVFVSFTVAPTGRVTDAAVAKGFRPDCDSAALAGVRQLPRFEPGQQMGRPVPVRFTLPVNFRLPAALSDSTKRVYTYVDQMPLYQGEEGTKSLSEDLLREFRAASGSGGCPVPSAQILVSLKVGPSGTIYDVKTMRNQSAYAAVGQADAAAGRSQLPVACEQALAAAARKLPRLTPGTQNGQRVAVSYAFLLNSSGQ